MDLRKLFVLLLILGFSSPMAGCYPCDKLPDGCRSDGWKTSERDHDGGGGGYSRGY